MQTHTARLDELGELEPGQKQDSMWTFASEVESLSNSELSAVFQTFTSAEMDLLQTALMHEGQTNRNAVDARRAAAQLFDLQALILREISNRNVNEQIDQTAGDLSFEGMPEKVEEGVQRPKTLTGQFGGNGPVARHSREHDISAANLVSLAEVGARSATVREKTALAEQARLRARRLDAVTVKELGDTLRKADLTIKIQTEHLIGGPTSILDHPDEPMANIFHLHDQGIDPKGPGYRDERDATEKVLFPELQGHGIMADERPVYGALNLKGAKSGAISSRAGYGTSTIVLRPHVAKRATYSANDTFFAARIDVSRPRRDVFYALMDGDPRVPLSLKDALRDPGSQERRDFEAWLDELALIPDASVSSFKEGMTPLSVTAHILPPGNSLEHDDAVYRSFKAFLTDCFGDPDATRGVMATHDNLEALITKMDDVDGNALARTVLENRKGAVPRTLLFGVQYIEAQIQGPLIPSRDIAEIRIDLDEVPEDQVDDLRARARQYEQTTGVKVTFMEAYDLEEAENREIDRVELRENAFNMQHLDMDALEKAREDHLEHLSEKVSALLRDHGDIGSGLPEGELRLDGNALQKLGSKFNEVLDEELAKPGSKTVGDVVSYAFEKAALPMLKQKAALLRELDTMGFNDAQRAAVAHWIVSAQDLRSAEEMRTVMKHAEKHAAMLREMAGAEPPLAAAEILRRMHAFTADMDQDFAQLIDAMDDPDFGPDNLFTEMGRVSFLSLALLQHGEPPLDEAGMRRLHERFNSPEVSSLTSQLSAIAADGSLKGAADRGRLVLIRNQMLLNGPDIARQAGEEYAEPESFIGGLSLLQEPLRAVLREIAPETARKLDDLHPGYAPMPAPADPQSMPQDEAQRRAFCVQVMDGYLEHEKTFEEGVSTHGRGHIARAYIFANAMCNMLEEQGIKVDKNAVLCGIAGHDLGREGPGNDNWEERSGNMTVERMGTAFGADAMGQEYGQEIKNCIHAHKSPTLEGMLLNAADSLDIGRTKDFMPEYFRFLQGRQGETPGAEAQRIRKQLAKEADLLQRLTNPLCANKEAIQRFQLLANDPDLPRQKQDEYLELQKSIIKSAGDAFRSDWEVSSEDYLARFENVVRSHPKMFPLLSKYYH
ncbi:MAG: DUF3626 domain-containing protein [Mailhella sp.]|nr:DUF3626 domain-containing protein [Mailhella sp.]